MSRLFVCYLIQRIEALKFKGSAIVWRLLDVWCPGNSVDHSCSGCGTRTTTDTSAVDYWYAAVIKVL